MDQDTKLNKYVSKQASRAEQSKAQQSKKHEKLTQVF